MGTNFNIHDLKQIFEAAMVVLHDGKQSERSESALRLLRRQRALRTRTERADLQQRRTMAEAANALSALWHLSYGP